MKCYGQREKCEYFKDGKCIADFKCWWHFKQYNGKLDVVEG